MRRTKQAELERLTAWLRLIAWFEPDRVSRDLWHTWAAGCAMNALSGEPCEFSEAQAIAERKRAADRAEAA